MEFGFPALTIRDRLAKARRELEELIAAERSRDEIEIRNCAENLAITVDSLQDWLKRTPTGAKLRKGEAAQLFTRIDGYDLFKFISNTSKHGVASRVVEDLADGKFSYSYTTSGAVDFSSATAFALAPTAPPRLKLKWIAPQQERLELVALARKVIEEVEAFRKEKDI